MAESMTVDAAEPIETATVTDLPEFFEIIDGEVVELPPMGFKQVALINELKRLVDAALGPHPSGRFFIEGLFDLRPAVNRNRRPDGAYVSFERWPKARPFPEDNALPAVPDLAVEVVSPTDTADGLIEKVHEYFAAGCRLVWVVYSSVEEVYIYEAPKSVRVLGRDDVLDGVDVLPGFRLPLTELFVPEEGEPA